MNCEPRASLSPPSVFSFSVSEDRAFRADEGPNLLKSVAIVNFFFLSDFTFLKYSIITK